MTANARPRPFGDRFPTEVKRLIVQYASKTARTRLALVNSAWRDVSEEMIWQEVKIIPDTRDRFGDERRAAVAEVWWDRLNAMDSRPARYRKVRRLRLRTMHTVMNDVVKLLEHVSNTVELIAQYSEYFDNERPSLARAIGAVRCLPSLTRLYLDLDDTWEDDLYAALSSTPSLIELEIETQVAHAGSAASRVDLKARPTLNLPRLSKVKLDSPRWQQGLVMILEGAKVLDTLCLDSSSGSDPHIDLGSHAAATIEACSSITHIEFQGLEAYALRNAFSGSRWMPGLRTLVTHSWWGPDCLPAHLGLRSITFELGSGTDTYSGSMPSKYVTGLIGSWFEATLIDLPGVDKIDLIPAYHQEDFPPGLREGLFFGGSFQITSYTNRADELFVVEYFASDNGSPLGPHELSYTADEHDWDVPPAITTHPTIDIGESVLLTSYRGYPLPWILLQHIYRLIDAGDFHSTAAKSTEDSGKRGKSLPEEAWVLLEGWHSEIKAQESTEGSE